MPPKFVRQENPYTRAMALIDASKRVQNATGAPLLGRSKLWQCRRIAALEETWGLNLDRLGATHAMLRWVAGPGMPKAQKNCRSPRAIQVEARYYATVAFLEGRSPHLKFKDLMASFPTIDPRTGLVTHPAEQKNLQPEPADATLSVSERQESAHVTIDQ